MKTYIHECAAICNKCYNVTSAFKFKMEFEKEVNEMYVSSDSEDMFKLNSYCDECQKFTSHFVVDKGIAETVSLMNKLGYHTVYSCEGHYSPDEKYICDKISQPYVFIKNERCNDKLLTNELFKKLYSAKWNEFTIGQRESFRRINLNRKIDKIMLLDSPVFSFYYNEVILIKEHKRLKEKYNNDEKKITQGMKRYFKKVIKDLNNILKEELSND